MTFGAFFKYSKPFNFLGIVFEYNKKPDYVPIPKWAKNRNSKIILRFKIPFNLKINVHNSMTKKRLRGKLIVNAKFKISYN